LARLTLLGLIRQVIVSHTRPFPVRERWWQLNHGSSRHEGSGSSRTILQRRLFGRIASQRGVRKSSNIFSLCCPWQLVLCRLLTAWARDA